MARLKRGDKSRAIRAQLEIDMNAAPKDVVATLKAQGIKVTSQMVSTLKGKMKGGTTKRKGRPKKAASGGALDIDILIKAKRLAEQLGGVDKAKDAMDALAKLQQ